LFRPFVHARPPAAPKEEIQLKQRLSCRTSVRAATLLALVASLVLASVAMGDGSSATAPAPTPNNVFITAKGGLKFVAPKTIVTGEDLTVTNQTNPKQVGPHTFSLVTKGSIPKTPKARQLCFTPHHICMAIAHWLGTNGKGPVTKNPAKAGAEGWDTLGSVTKKGDSWFTGEKEPGTSITQQVTAAAGTTIYFMCAVHPWMHGSIEVLPPAGS
jgi:hypothetical protein